MPPRREITMWFDKIAWYAQCGAFGFCAQQMYKLVDSVDKLKVEAAVVGQQMTTVAKESAANSMTLREHDRLFFDLERRITAILSSHKKGG